MLIKKIQLFIEQFKFFIDDYKKLSGSKKPRMLYIWLGRVSVGILFFRFDRAMYLLLGRVWTVFRILFYPVITLTNVYSNIEVNYKAEIGPGLTILHPALGVVITGSVKIGKNFTLVGGNVIAGKAMINGAKFVIGDNVVLGANAIILGPCTVSDHTVLGASALVNKDTKNEAVMVGVPAKDINHKENV